MLLLGCVLTYAMQNVFAFNFLGDVAKVSMGYKRKVALVIVAAIFKRYKEKEAAPTRNELSTIYGIPMRIVGDLTFDMHDRGLIYNVILPHEQVGFAPAVDYETLSVGQLFRQLDMLGDSDFIPLFSEIYPQTDRKGREQRSEIIRYINHIHHINNIHQISHISHIMEKIASFTINHEVLEPGIYVSRKDRTAGGDTVTTRDTPT